jgi:serine/threonine-protein kinase HipA
VGASGYSAREGIGAPEACVVTAQVLLGQDLIGYLASAGDQVTFTFDGAYLARADRPVLGQAFEDRNLGVDVAFGGSTARPLPSFFRNALPEGALRKVVERRIPSSRLLELDMLLLLGPDLPGALRVLPDPLEEARGPAKRVFASSPGLALEGDPIRFSLSGVQLKASVNVDMNDETKVTLPLVGGGGRWIAKFPSPSFRLLAENENAMLAWAAAAGLCVPEHRLVDVASIENLPEEFPREGHALLVERFDRARDGVRIHQEDFAQVFEIEPEEKDLVGPQAVTYGGIGAVVCAVAGRGDFLEFTRRIAFMVLSGNADAHAKNWSLIYPDRVHARLSPVYDVVSTIAYPRLHRRLALGLVDSDATTSPALSGITYADIRELATWAGEPPDAVESEVRGFVERARAAWRDVRSLAPEFVAEAIDVHLATVAL